MAVSTVRGVKVSAGTARRSYCWVHCLISPSCERHMLTSRLSGPKDCEKMSTFCSIMRAACSNMPSIR